MRLRPATPRRPDLTRARSCSRAKKKEEELTAVCYERGMIREAAGGEAAAETFHVYYDHVCEAAPPWFPEVRCRSRRL